MSKEIESLRTFDGDDSKVSDEMKSKIDSAIDTMLKKSHSRVTKLLTDHKDELDLLATSLLLKKTLFADEIKALIGDHQRSKNETIEGNIISNKNEGFTNAFDLMDTKNELNNNKM